MTLAIDIMNYAPFVAPGLSGPEFQYQEFQTMVQTTFRGMISEKGTITTLAGREVPPDGKIDIDPTLQLDRAVEILDRTEVEAVVLSAVKMWSYHYHHKLILDYPEDVIGEAIGKAGDRFIGAAGYNPFRIDQSLRTIEMTVRELGFTYVYFHPLTFGVAPDDRRCYPLYAKCTELGIPVGMQVGHSAETLPSEYGHPMSVDKVAIDFPDLKINMSHTGWPWTGEFISVIWRHPNVYGDISAYFPSGLDPELVSAMDGRLRNKIMFGTNGFDAGRVRSELEQLPLREKSVDRILRANALEFLGL